MKKLFLLSAFIISSLTLWANGTEINGIYYLLDASTNTASVTYTGNSSYSNSYSGAIVIPESVMASGITYSVTSIGTYAFNRCSGLISVTIPNSVTSIGNYAFSDCSALTSVTISNSVTSIGYQAFYYCSGLTSIEIPNSVTSIGNYAFSDCSALTSVTISNSLTSISSNAFHNCSRLASIEIPNSVTSIGESAFSSCSGLTSVSIPNSVTSIGTCAFEACKVLISIEIPNSVTSIGNSAFYNCSRLTSATIGNAVTSIGNSAFEACKVLTSIEIPNSVISIGKSAFYNCSGLTSVTIHDGITSIGESAFSSCSSLTSIEIPGSVTSIGNSAFLYCSRLTSVTIHDGVTSIGESAFSSCSSLTSIEIPNSVTSISGAAFFGCSRLTSVSIPNSVTSIGNSAFSGCSGLTSVTCYASVPPTMGTSCFYWVSNSIPVYVPCGSLAEYQAADIWSDFTNIQEMECEAEILDLEDGVAFENDEKRLTDGIQYSRNFANANAYAAFYLPFNIAITDELLEEYTFSKLYAYIPTRDTDGDGEPDEESLYVMKLRAGDIAYANNIYFVKAKTAGTHTFESCDNYLYPSESRTIECSTAEKQFNFTGVYERTTILNGSRYVATDGTIKRLTAASANLSPYRWYITVERKDGVYCPEEGEDIIEINRIITIGEDIDEATALELLETSRGNTFEQADNSIYTITGQRVATDESALPAGIYIRNKKKFIINH